MSDGGGLLGIDETAHVHNWLLAPLFPHVVRLKLCDRQDIVAADLVGDKVLYLLELLLRVIFLVILIRAVAVDVADASADGLGERVEEETLGYERGAEEMRQLTIFLRGGETEEPSKGRRCCG